MKNKINTIKDILEHNYRLGKMISVKKISLGGLMNDNFKLVTENQVYFVKAYKYYSFEKISTSHKLLKELSKRGFKTNTLVENTYSETCTQTLNNIYTCIDVSYFIEDAKIKPISYMNHFDIEQVAVLLARYHKSVKNINLNLGFVNIFSFKDTLTSFKKIKNIILKKGKNMDSFDVYCLEMVNYKISKIESESLVFNFNHLKDFPILVNHGDFLSNNILFDKTGIPAYVIDFEHIVNSFRVWDVVKTAVFLSRMSVNEIFHCPIDIESFVLFIKRYDEINNLTEQELELISDLCYISSLLSDFTLYGHYIALNPNAKLIALKSHIEYSWWEINKEKVYKALKTSFSNH